MLRYAIVGIAAALAVAVVGSSPAHANEKIAAEEGLSCVACHDKPGSKRLTDRGKYFETLGTMDGFEELSSAFGKCTRCHVRRPGSLKLTRTGRRLASVVEDMEELREWLNQRHPLPPEVPEER